MKLRKAFLAVFTVLAFTVCVRALTVLDPPVFVQETPTFSQTLDDFEPAEPSPATEFDNSVAIGVGPVLVQPSPAVTDAFDDGKPISSPAVEMPESVVPTSFPTVQDTPTPTDADVLEPISTPFFDPGATDLPLFPSVEPSLSPIDSDPDSPSASVDPSDKLPNGTNPPLPVFVPRTPTPVPTPFVSDPSSSAVFSESDIFTGGPYRASGNVINFPEDVLGDIESARINSKPLDIVAIHVKFSTTTSLSSIPKLRVMAHLCTFESGTVLDISAPENTAVPPPKAAVGLSPAKATSGTNGGDVELLCGFLKGRTSTTTVQIISRGSNGISGGLGGDGKNGITGTPGSVGQCKRRVFFFCRTQRGSPGRLSTAGTNGGRGGEGGDGGNGGHVMIIHGGISTGFVITGVSAAGNGGVGGAGGIAGVNGAFIPPIRYVTRCSGCSRRYEVENRPILPPTNDGPSGTSGSSGSQGSLLLTPGLNDTAQIFGDGDFLRFSALLERYYNDLILSKASTDEAIFVIDTLKKLAFARTDNSLLRSISNQGEMAAKSLQLQKALFGPASHSRRTPNSIEAELERELEYAEAVKDQLESLRQETNIVSVLAETAAISIPATNYQALSRDLRIQRDIFRDAVIDIEGRIESAVDEVSVVIQAHINRKKDEADKRRQEGLLKAVVSIVNIASGVLKLDFMKFFDSVGNTIDVIKDISFKLDEIVDTFEKVGNATDGAKDFIGEAFEIGKDILEVKDALEKAERNPSCSIEELQAFLLPAPEIIDKFPNLVSLDADFSIIQDVGVVSELSSALTKIRASQFGAEFGCLFGEQLDDLPRIERALDNYFILVSSRIEILARMVDIDIELRRLNIVAEGVENQKNQLEELRSEALPATGSDTLVLLSISFEAARMSVIETIEKLTESFSNIALRRMDEDILGYARERLSQNGAFGFSSATQFVNLRKLHIDVVDRFKTVRGCTKGRQLLTSAYYAFDITKENSPDLFMNGLRTGPNNRSTIVLDIEKDCAVYANSRPPLRGVDYTGTGSLCHPGVTNFNSRMISVALELLGGDQSLLPSRTFQVFSSIEQVGRQGFHAKPGFYTHFNVEPIHLPLGSLQLMSGGPSDVLYNPTCVVDGGLDTVNLEEPRICPSPFSTYVLQIGLGEDAALHPFLASVDKIRFHARLVSHSNGRVAEVCFDS